MFFANKENYLSKNDSLEKNLILVAFWKKCIKKPDKEGIDYLKTQLRKYMLDRSSTFQSQIEQNINRITC